jgi:hypothetical protein
MDDILADNVDEIEDSETRKLRVAFCAELLVEVMKTGGPRPWKEWAIITEHYYQGKRQAYLDNDMSQILTSGKGDWWLRASYINNPKTRSLIRDYLAESGVYIAQVTGKGVTLAGSNAEIKRDYQRSARSVKGRSDRLSYRADKLNSKRGTELPLIVTQALLPRGD